MKRRLIKRILITAILTMIACILVSKLYWIYVLDYETRVKISLKTCSKEEKKIGEEFKEEFQKIADYSGKKEDASWIEKMGPLNDFYYFIDDDVVDQNMKVKFITAEIDDNKGKIWYDVKIKTHEKWYTGKVEEVDEKGIIHCTIRKENNNWIVTDYYWAEHDREVKE